MDTEGISALQSATEREQELVKRGHVGVVNTHGMSLGFSVS